MSALDVTVASELEREIVQLFPGSLRDALPDRV
jgi:hypothetical protein